MGDPDSRAVVFPACRWVSAMTREAAGASTMRTCQGSSRSFSSRRHHALGESVYNAWRAISFARLLTLGLAAGGTSRGPDRVPGVVDLGGSLVGIGDLFEPLDRVGVGRGVGK